MRECRDWTNKWSGYEGTCQPGPGGSDSLQWGMEGRVWGFFGFFVCLFFVFSRVTCGGSQTGGLISAVAAGLCQSHSNTGSEPRWRPTPQLTAMPDP